MTTYTSAYAPDRETPGLYTDAIFAFGQNEQSRRSADTTQWAAFKDFFDNFEGARPEGYTGRHGAMSASNVKPSAPKVKTSRDLFSLAILAVIVVALLSYGWVGLTLAGLSLSLVALPATSLTIAGVLLAAGIFTLAERKYTSGY